MTRRALVAVIGAALIWSAPASAATINVTTEADSVANDGACSLREAISSANGNAPSGAASGECTAGLGTDSVVIPVGTFKFERPGIDDNNSGGDLDITSAMAVRGAGAESTIVDADGIDRVFQVHGDENRQVAIESLTVTGGHAQGPGSFGFATGGPGSSPGGSGASATATEPGANGADGGGIWTLAELTLTRVAITGNRAGDGGVGFNAFGGDGAKGANLVSGQPNARGGNGGSAIATAGGRGGSGGGIWSNAEDTFISESSITDNRAGDGGDGGVAEGGDGGDGGDPGSGTAPSGGTGGNATAGAGGTGGRGGGISADDVDLISTTVARNRSGDGGDGGDPTPGRGGNGGRSSTGGNGGAGGDGVPGAAGSGGAGGGVRQSSDNSFVLTNVTVTDNAAGNGGDGGSTTSFGGNGGDGTNGNGGNGGAAGTVTPVNGGNGGQPGGADVKGAFTSGTVVDNRSGAPGVGGLSERNGGNPGTSLAGGSSGSSGSGDSAVHGTNGQAGNAGGLTGGVDLSVRSSIVAANTPLNCDGAVALDGLTLSFPDNSCVAAEVADPKLGPLEDNGGLGETFRLEPGSPALDRIAAGTQGCPATDERGIGRPQGAQCDLGAYESAAPAATTGGATAIGATGATLDGVVRANQNTASIRFEYGATTAYGSSTPAREAGDGTNDAPVSEPVGGLAPNTTYHYRLVATTAGGAATGADAMFTTSAAPLGAPGSPGGPGGGAGGPGGVLPDTVNPTVQGLSVTRAFRAAGSGGSIARAAASPVGATIRYTISEPGRTTFTVEKPGTGRKVGRRCVKQTRRNKKNKRCKLYTTLRGSFTHTGQAGSNSFKFTGRLANKKLRPGSYRLVAVTTDAAGNKSAAKRTNFKVVRR